MNNKNSNQNSIEQRSQKPNPNVGNGAKPSIPPAQNPNPNFTPPPSKK